mmetsp:Transcript_81398/g.143694  ORF Transcript_81398/g.143694 Transcript_81398/m.143694 type:complete len:1646 (-) Transcript_81398:190-5127(-)
MRHGLVCFLLAVSTANLNDSSNDEASNASFLLRANASASLFADANLRINQDGTCAGEGLAGSVRVVAGGTELHHTSDRSWLWSEERISCSASSACQYSSGKGAYWCQAEGSHEDDIISCECQACPCPLGYEGFACSNCAAATKCGDGRSCSQTGRISTEVDRPYSCTFSDAWRHLPSYRIFWHDGWAQPIAYVTWLPSRARIQLDLVQNMCRRSQPILFQCECSACNVHEDLVDALTGERTGLCSDKSLPTPCSKCQACTCSYPPETSLSYLTQQIIGQVTGGIHVGCQDRQNSSICTAILDDLPMKLEFDCQAGTCVDDEMVTVFEALEAPEDPVPIGPGVEQIAKMTAKIVSQWNNLGWSTRAAFILALTLLLSTSVLLFVACRGACRHRLAMNAPQAPPPGMTSEGKAPMSFALEWSGVSCVRSGKTILNQCSGSLSSRADGSGSLVALVGPSGCGKTTLLEAIAGKVAAGDEGSVALNGRKLEPGKRQRLISVVRQDDILGASLTVRETLAFSAALRLRGLSSAERAGRVSWALDMLKLGEVADCKIGDALVRGISGGERRRVAIGVELVVSPTVMILDEPTTGLDASCALSLGHVLSSLALDGRLVICSVHQPRPELLALFNEIKEMGPGGSFVSRQPEASRGKADESKPDAEPIVDLSSAIETPAVSDPGAYERAAGVASAWLPVQMLELWRRSLQETLRGGRGDLWAAVIVAGIGCFVGLTFKDLDTGIAGVQNRFGSIFFVQLFFAFFGLKACSSWYVDRARFEREREAHLYSALAYVVSKSIAYLWWYCLILPLIFVAVSYTLIGYRQDGLAKPLTYLLCICGAMASSSGISLLCLSCFSSYSAGMSTSAICLTVMLMYSGFLQRREAIPAELRWLVNVSPFSHSFAAMISNELGGLETTIDASGYSSMNIQGEIWLYQFNIIPEDLPDHVRALGIFAGSVWLLALLPWQRPFRSRAFKRLWHLGSGKKTVCDVQEEAAVVKIASGQGSDRIQLKASGALTWQDLFALLPTGRTIYEGLDGMADVGKPLAVLGPSGCGKSTLLSCLSGESSSVDWTGTVCLGKQEMTARQLSRAVGYVRQDDALMQELTVKEAIAFAAALRLHGSTPKQQARRVDWVIKRLGLECIAASRVGGEKCRGISGGERRRTAVGVELVASSGVLVLDEPTSGLDETAALGLSNLLADLAKEGCVVIASLHQPRHELLQNFQDTLVLGPGGRVAYFGRTCNLSNAADAICPQRLSSAADCFLDLVTSAKAKEAFKAYRGSSYEAEFLEEMRKVKEASGAAEAEVVPQRQLPPIRTQLRHLLLRELRVAIRDRTLAPAQYGGALLAGLLLGFTYYQARLNLAGVISRVGLFFAVECILGMQALQGLMAWRQGHTSFVRERAAGYYSTGAFVLAKMMVDSLLLRFGPPVLMCLVMYQLVGLVPGREAVCCLGFCLASLASSAFCMAMGAAAPRSTALLPVAVLMILLFLLFGGILLSRAPAVFGYASYFRASYHMLVANEFKGQFFKFDPSGFEADFEDFAGEEWMRLLHIQDRAVGEQVGWLLGWTVVYVLFAWAALALQSGGPKRMQLTRRKVPKNTQVQKVHEDAADTNKRKQDVSAPSRIMQAASRAVQEKPKTGVGEAQEAKPKNFLQ